MEEQKLKISCNQFYQWPERKRIVCIGSRVVVLYEETLETIHTFTKPQNPCFAYADEKQLIIMSTVGKFVVYRLPEMVEASSFQLKGVDNTNNGFLYDAAKNQILAIATTRSGDKLFTIDVGNSTIQSEELPLTSNEENVTLHSLLRYDGAICRLQCERNKNGNGYFSTTLYRVDGKEVKRFGFEMTCARQLDTNLFYDLNGIADFSTGRYQSFRDMGLADSVIYGVTKTRTGFAIATGAQMVYCDQDFHIVDREDVKYAADYLETDRYALIGTWEKVIVRPL